MEATILRSDVLRQLDTGEPFTLAFVTADRKRGTGGQLITVKNWVKQETAVVAERKPSEHKKGARSRPSKTLVIYNPHNRLQHATSVHVRLLQIFNGKRIING